ncbi:Arsenite methyltransferase [Bagarius yarrelli]|uniref:Arsenite methyltransferase n=1 Tax=Bagarius yarrelli TaxID=175774 RepID=A0A556TRR4_BAGYA|nr:Arsenite methyltransferase [Bagarius yarrelli]
MPEVSVTQLLRGSDGEEMALCFIGVSIKTDQWPVNRNPRYYSSLDSSDALQTSAACGTFSQPLSLSVQRALQQVHPEVSRRFFGCGLVAPEKLKGCSVLDLGSGSGRDCYVLSKLVGEDGHVTGIDMTEDLIQTSRKYIQYHQECFGYARPNTQFVHGYMEKLCEAGIQDDSLDVVVYKRAVLGEAYKVLKPGGELYFSDMYSSEVVPESFKLDPVLWGEGMGGALYWHDFITIMKDLGFSTPRLVSASRIDVHNSELRAKAGDIKYASGTYRAFKLPKHSVQTKALVTYKGTVPDWTECFQLDAANAFKIVQITDKPDPSLASAQQ